MSSVMTTCPVCDRDNDAHEPGCSNDPDGTGHTFVLMCPYCLCEPFDVKAVHGECPERVIQVKA